MRAKHLACVAVIASVPLLVGAASVGTTPGGGDYTASTEAEGTLWGIYGEHSLHDCPVNNRETAKFVVATAAKDLRPLMAKYGVTAVVDRYHSGLEHTFLWAVMTTEPHQLEEFAIELGIARWNNLKFVPLRTFEEGVVPDVRAFSKRRLLTQSGHFGGI